MSISHKEQLRQKIEYLEREIADSKIKNLELENYLLKLKSEEMNETIKESNSIQLLKG